MMLLIPSSHLQFLCIWSRAKTMLAVMSIFSWTAASVFFFLSRVSMPCISLLLILGCPRKGIPILLPDVGRQTIARPVCSSWSTGMLGYCRPIFKSVRLSFYFYQWRHSLLASTRSSGDRSFRYVLEASLSGSTYIHVGRLRCYYSVCLTSFLSTDLFTTRSSQAQMQKAIENVYTRFPASEQATLRRAHQWVSWT